jgi:aspartate dehydrogenase
LKIGIIGCGAIGTLIAESVENGIVRCEGLILYDSDMGRSANLKKLLHIPIIVVESVEEMIRLRPAVIVESASQTAAKQYVGKVLGADIDLIVMSVGALLDLDVQSNRLHVPSGAIGGIDAIDAASLVGVTDVTLTTRKNPKVLDMDNREEKTVYEGDAKEAVKRFPREMNVAARLALAVKPVEVKVQVVSDPKVDRNVHEVNVKWKHGEMWLRFSNEPHPANPKTSALAAWSAISLLKKILERQV